jgi:serine protease Do
MGSDAGGVLVAEVSMGSTAAKAGFQKNDFIQSADGAPMKNVTAFLKAMRAIPSGSTARLAIIRRQKSETVQVPKSDAD